MGEGFGIASKIWHRVKDSWRVLVPILVLILAVSAAAAWFFLLRETPSPEPAKKGEVQEIDLGNGIKVKKIDSKYKVAAGKTSGFFKTGQSADILLSGVDFNNSGGPLLFNHPGNIASDGRRLLLADRNNNRILIWNSLPSGNTKPDLVLGQKDFTANDPGRGLDQLNWPVGLATDGTHVIVADTYNHRILIWNSLPTKNAQAADLVLESKRTTLDLRTDTSPEIAWPWGVWTDGQKLIVASTGAARVLIWNSFPTQNNQKADVVLSLKGKFGTPRSVGSDGKHLVVGDHNAFGGSQGNFFWKSFPTSHNQPYDFFMPGLIENVPPPQGQPPGQNNPPPPTPSGQDQLGVTAPPTAQPATSPGDVFWGPTFTPDGKLLVLSGASVAIWDHFPENDKDQPSLVIGRSSGPNSKVGSYSFLGGDGSGMALAGSRLYISLSNGNKIVGFNSLPTKKDAKPDFAIGAPDINTNTLDTAFIMSNPVPASNGKSLFVSSDFDRRLYVWKNLPDESGAKPDLVYSLPGAPWDNVLFGETFALAGKKAVYIWKKLPTEARAPDIVFNDQIGGIKLEELLGVALDEKYFYLADSGANKIYVWEGLPSKDSAPKFSLESERPGRLSSDGKFLVVSSTEAPKRDFIRIYKINELSNGSTPKTIGGPGSLNLPQSATVEGGYLFVADTGFNRLLIWKSVEEALAGKQADAVLGVTGRIEMAEEATPEIGKDKLFWPANPCFDGKYLWLGEFKFSERLLRFSPS